MILTIKVAGAASGGPSGRDAVINFSATPPPGWRPVNPALAPAPPLPVADPEAGRGG